MMFRTNFRKVVRLSMQLGIALGLLASTSAAQSSCPALSSSATSFNGTSILTGSYIWFNANFTATGIPSTGATIDFTNSTITFMAGQSDTVQVPNAEISFDPAAVCASTTFDTATNTWRTRVPLMHNDEIFLSGVAFPVPASFALAGGRVQGNVTWQGNFSASVTGIQIGWKWSAAVYKGFSTDYNVLGIKPTHTGSCLYNNSDHAGTPEEIDPSSGLSFKSLVTGGARGGGGSDWTGGWSGTDWASACFSAPPPPPPVLF